MKKLCVNILIIAFATLFITGCSTELFEITDNDELIFIGELANGEKIAHKTSAGKKVYMAYGTAADFMLTNVENGRLIIQSFDLIGVQVDLLQLPYEKMEQVIII